MSKYFSIFFLILMVNLIFFNILGSLFMGGGDPTEDLVLTIGTIIIILLSILISQIWYLIDFLKENR